MEKLLLLFAGLSFFSLLQSAEKPKHFGAQEEKPAQAFLAAVILHNAGVAVPVDCDAESMEPMNSAENRKDLFKEDSKGRLTPLVSGDKEKLFSLGEVATGSLAIRRRAKSLGSLGSQGSAGKGGL